MNKFMLVKETILLIGGSGFIGSNLIDFVLKNNDFSDYKFVVLSRSLKREPSNNVVYITGDFTDKTVLINLFSKWNFTKVFHFATSTTPLTSGNNILCDINGNLIATIGLLDIMKEFECKSIVYLSSGGAVYGEKKLEKISENEICNPVSSYGVVKLTIENYIRLYQKQNGINYLILRVSNPFGKFHSSEKQGVINIAIRRALLSEPVEIWGDGLQSKDYIFVDDLVKVIFALVEQKVLNKTINVGSGETHQLNKILEIIKIYMPNLKVNYVGSKTTDVKDFCLDVSVMKSFYKLKLVDMNDAIQKTILFERERLN
ncbi:NAD-dependent epimerase/dehydratase family protein [Flavobacterium sp. I-SCBP12n]|uniref:NAD-dependent epimerase/dehydratase family protein n=1 Tax=Flavobacterium pygoscelis TaxID=2893176 RepID=A0A9X1XQY9_9FLAO|nr:NAD-dependent epimerase/dehydratase family protein [Flavobacterium pygoscelis]MCK8141464.1 NAD-dependent epimerase/dehydratase family protein [Flavobacterium pygoscelis]